MDYNLGWKFILQSLFCIIYKCQNTGICHEYKNKKSLQQGAIVTKDNFV